MKMKRKRSLNRQESKFAYDSPLKVFKTSSDELTSLVGNIVHKKDRRLSRRIRKLSKQNAADSSKRKSSLRNSIIIINDSDSEKDDGNNVNETNVGDENASLSIIECSSVPTSPLQQKRKLRTSAKQNTNKSLVIPSDNKSDNDLSVLCLTDTQDCLNGENIAPSQMEDDVVELWSCLNSLNVSKDKKNANKRMRNVNKDKKGDANKDKKEKRCNRDERDSMFVIDTTPNLNYLKFLRTNTNISTENLQKRKMKQDLSCNKTTAKSFVKPFKRSTLKCSDNNKKKRHHNNNWHSSPLKLNICYSNKLQKEAQTTDSDENSRINLKRKLREIIIDGCNIAMNHTHGKEFSEKGIQIVVNYFQERGHVVKVFLPQHVRRKEYTFLEQLYKEGTVIFTPSRKIAGRQITSYDDRFILKYATSCGGIVISSDQYRDLYKEKPEWRNTILNRLLIPTFVGDYIMFPEDPLGKFGPNLERFLRH